MRFSRGVALPGERVLPLPQKRGRLLDRWGIGVERRDGLFRLERNVMRPEVCAMICAVFRLPFNEKIRKSRIYIIQTSAYSMELDTLAGLKGNPLALSRLMNARIEIPDHVREMFSRHSLTIPRHSRKNFTDWA